MINKIVNDKESLELLMKYAFSQSKAKKTSEIFENFLKIAQANENELQKFQDSVKYQASYGNVNDLIKDFERLKYIDVFMNFFLKLDNEKKKSKTSDIMTTYFADQDKKEKWFKTLFNTAKEIKETGGSFSLQTFLIGLYNRFFESKQTDKNLTGVDDYVFDTPDLQEDDRIKQIDENLSKDPETLEKEKKLQELKNDLPRLFEEAKNQKRYYISYVYELFKYNIEELEKDLHAFEDKISSGELENEFENNPKEFLAKYNKKYNRPQDDQFQSLGDVIKAETAFFEANRDALIENITKFVERAQTEAPAISKIFPQDGAVEAQYPYSIETVEEQANKNIEHVNLDQLVNSIVNNPYYVLPSGYENVKVFSNKLFGDDIFLKEFIKAQMQGIIYDETFKEMNVSQPSPKQYAEDRNRNQGGMIILSAPRFSAWLLKQKSEYLAELAKKRMGGEYSTETFVDMINTKIDDALGIITLDSVTGEYTRTPGDEIRGKINDPFYNWAGQIAFVSAFFDAEVQVVADLLKQRDNLTDDEAKNNAIKKLSGEPEIIFRKLQKWVSESPGRVKSLKNFFNLKSQESKTLIEENLGKNMQQVLREFQFSEEEIKNAENEIVEIVHQRLFPEEMSTVPLVRFYSKAEKDFDEGDFYDALGTPTLRNLSDFKGAKRSPKPIHFTELYKSQIVDKLESNIDQLVFELINNGLSVDKPLKEIYEDFDNTDANLEKYKQYLLKTLQDSINFDNKTKIKLERVIVNKIEDLKNGKFGGAHAKSRFEKEDTMFKDFETIPKDVYQDLVKEILKNLLSNYLAGTTQRFQQTGMQFEGVEEGYENTKVPSPYVPGAKDLALLNVLSEEIIDKIQDISNQYGGRFKKYQDWQRQQKSNSDIDDEITEASTQNTQKKVTSKVLDEMIKKYASKR